MSSIIGYHYSSGGAKQGIGSWIDYATQQGIPVGLKGVSDYGLIFEAIQKGNPGWFVYRLSAAAGSVSREVPNYTTDPVIDAEALAAETIAKLPPEFDKTKVWVELINEPRGKWTDEPVWGGLHPVDYLGEWCLAAAGYLNAQGYKFCGPSFNSGEPGDDGQPLADATAQYLQPGMRAYLQYCADNTDMAALAVHDYVWSLPAPQYPQLWGRWEAAIAAADLAGIPRTFNIFVTEWGYSPSNAPEYPAVAPDLDQYNQIAARFPQVKFAAAWTLQGDYEPVDSQVLTWIDYPIDKEFDRGPQPAVTHAAFGGTLPDEPEEPMPDNLLYNPSFENGWENQDGGHRPKLWRLDWKLDGGNVLGESQVKPQDQIPEEERRLFFVPPDETSWYMLKVFKDHAAIRPKLYTAPEQFPDLPAGRYRYSFYIYPDVYVTATGNQKVWSDNPNDCRIRLYWNGVQGDWKSLHPYGGDAPRFITYEWDHPGGPAQIGFQCDMPNAENGNNGFMTDAHDLRLVEDEPTMTWEQQAWQLGIQKKVLGFRTGAGLQKRITADGYQALSNEVPFTRPDGVKLVIQRAKHAENGTFRTYYVIPPNYETIHVIDEETGTGGSDDADPKVEGVIDQLATHEWLTYTNRPLSAITTLTIHHSVSGGGPNPLAEVKSIAQYHVSPRPPDVPDGWPGIGYHFCIGADGVIYQVNHLETKSYHAGSWNAPGDENYWSAGICLLGNFTYSPPPQAQLDAARSLVAYLKGQLPTVTAVTRHKDMPGAQTQCPGNTNPQWFGYVAGETANDIDMRRFMIADPAAFRVVRMPDGRQEDIQDMQLNGGMFVRRKNQLGEWWKVDAQYFYLLHDTSPDTGGAGIERVYTLTKGGEIGAPKNPITMSVGQSWQESGTHYVQFRAKSGCGLLPENSGFASNTAVLVDHKTNVTFNKYGQNLTIDEVVWIKTGDEMQIYGRHNGKPIGWCGWTAPWGTSEIVELHWDRPPMTQEPSRYCSW